MRKKRLAKTTEPNRILISREVGEKGELMENWLRTVR